MRIARVLLVATSVVSFIAVAQGEEGISQRSRVELALRDYAKLMCSAVFISNRDLAEAQRDSGRLVTENIGSSYSALSEADRVATEIVVDRKHSIVTAKFRDFTPASHASTATRVV